MNTTTANTIRNVADYQCHINDCEKRLQILRKTLRRLEKYSKKIDSNKIHQKDKDFYYNQLNEMKFQIKCITLSILTLEQTSVELNKKKHLKKLKENLIETYNLYKQHSNYQDNDIDDLDLNDNQQRISLTGKPIHEQQIELYNISQQKFLCDRLENDLILLHDTFIDINRIVNEQDNMVNNIENELTNANDMINEAQQTVTSAVKTYERTKHARYIFIIFLVILFLVLVLIVSLIVFYIFRVHRI